MQIAHQITSVTEEGKTAQDIAALSRSHFKLTPMSLSQFLGKTDIAAELVVIDLSSIDKAHFSELAAQIGHIRRPEQPIMLIATRQQMSHLAKANLLQGNNVVSRPLGDTNFIGLIKSLIRHRRSLHREPAPASSPDIADYSTPDPTQAAAPALPNVEPIPELQHVEPDPAPLAPIVPDARVKPLLMPQALSGLVQSQPREGIITQLQSRIAQTKDEVTSIAIEAVARTLDATFDASGPKDMLNTLEIGAVTDILSQALRLQGLGGWIEAVRNSHSGTYQHCLLVAGTSVAFGRQFGFSLRDLERVTAAALLHDVGKIALPHDILDKPSALTSHEYEIIKSHTRLGYDIISKLDGFDDEMSDMVLSHHEYLDGSGYPNGLAGGQISDLVRIITIADIFSALVEQRPYKPALAGAEAYAIMRNMVGKLDMPLVISQERIMLAA
jgi:putative nucleotidyltransferase with HDIG domain